MRRYNYGGLSPQQMMGIAGMAGTMSGSMLSQNKDTTILGDVLSGAGMGATLGPWGALGGGILGLGKGLISQSQMTRQQKDEKDRMRVARQVEAWYSKEQQPYDTTGYYQMKNGGEVSGLGKMRRVYNGLEKLGIIGGALNPVRAFLPQQFDPGPLLGKVMYYGMEGLEKVPALALPSLLLTPKGDVHASTVSDRNASKQYWENERPLVPKKAQGEEIPYRMTPKQKMVISKKKMADGGAINSPISLNSTFYGKQPELMDLWKSNNSMDKLRYVSQRNSLDFTLPLISGKNHSLGFDASIGQNKTFETKINHQNSLGGSNLLPTEYRTDPIPWETKKEPFFNVGLNWQPGLSENKNTNKGTAQNTKIGIGYSYNNNTSGPYVLINPEAGITFGNQYSHYDKRRPFYYGMGARGKFRMDKENNGKIKGDSNEFRTHASEVEAYAKLNYKNKNGFGVNTKIGYDFDNEAPNFQIGLTKSFGGKKKNQSNFNIKDNVLFPIYDTFKNHDRTVYRNTRFLANGGEIIEAEGQETMMYPNGRMEDIKGPSHEQGGVTMKLKSGTKIFSNRIKARKDLIERLKNY